MDQIQSSSPQSPQNWGGYQLLSSEISRIGHWLTYEAEDTYGTRVMLRLLRATDVPVEMYSKLEEQLQKLCYLNHPNAFRILKSGKTETHFYIASEWTGNNSLNEWIAAGNEIKPLQLLLIVRQVIQALTAAQQKGIVHGNLSASRIFLDTDGRYKIDGFIGNSDIDSVMEDRKALAELLKIIMQTKARPEIHQRVAKVIEFLTNQNSEATSNGYREILKQIAPIISLCDGPKTSYDISLFCPYCRDPLTKDVVRCSICFTPHHKLCWKEARKCSVYNCKGNEPLRVWSKRRAIVTACSIAVISLTALIGWGFYFNERNRNVFKDPLPQVNQSSPKQISAINSQKLKTKPMRPNNALPQNAKLPPDPPPVVTPTRITVDIPTVEVTFPKPGAILKTGSVYKFTWVNTVPHEYWKSRDVHWQLNLGTHDRCGFYRLYSTTGDASSFEIPITDSFVISDDYKLDIYLAVDCKYEAPCFMIRQTGYNTIKPLTVETP